MQDTLGKSLEKLKWIRKRKNRIFAVLMILSLVVTLDVFWTLRQPGLTLAGDATCGILEHAHDEACFADGAECTVEEHTHAITCYADKTADVETPLDWQKMFAEYPYSGSLRQDLVGVAQTQVGYTESEANFEVDGNSMRRGYTRYGDWYSAPYNDWSAMFVSFCLSYAGASTEATPFNTGADSMAKEWDALGKYATTEAYTPVEGDLVFFTDSTVGIVTMVQNATFSAICGDLDDKVESVTLSFDDKTIAGWGITEGFVIGKEAEAVDNTDEENDEIVEATADVDYLDISDGPAVFLFDGGEKEQQVARFSLRKTRSIIDLKTYLDEHNGKYFYTLLDTNNRELPKDDNGNYIVTAGITYKLTLTITNPDGFVPGTYQYDLPEGMMVNGGTGSFVLTDKTNVGTWEVSDTGQISLDFNEHINSRTDITISATMGIIFPEQEEPLDFDGKITVTIEKPPAIDVTTELHKWGQQGNENVANKTDPTKIYWTALVTGQEQSQIPGSIITDSLLTGNQSYTESDMAAGIQFGVSEPNPVTGAEWKWHHWTVYPGDPNLTWTANGWTYQIPEIARCEDCGDLQLGNDNWVYYVNYSSTPNPGAGVGNLPYTNRVTVDGQQAEGWAEFAHGQAHADVIKRGTFHGDAKGGTFNWEFQVMIPGRKEGERAELDWHVIDFLRIVDDNYGIIGTAENTVLDATVTATNKGSVFNVPYINDISDEDFIAYGGDWSGDNGSSVTFSILCRCQCTEETCQSWNTESGTCRNVFWGNYNFCHCWIIEGDTMFTFSYETDGIPIIEEHGGLNRDLQNTVELHNRNNNWDSIKIVDDNAKVPIPGVFKKELTHDYNGYTANYVVTVNEGKLALTDGSPLTIHDMMSETLAFISGSLVVTTEDVNGNRSTLKQGIDYMVTYDGTGDAKDENGKPAHVLDIVILNPQPVMYILDYDTTLIIPPGTTQAVKYNNSATISLWGKQMSDSSEEKVYADINIAAKSFKVELHKTESQTGNPLPGATFGLYNQQGGLITSGVTDQNGQILFETDIIQGIILREHVPYYLKEIKAPIGFQLDDTKHWFCFCSETGNTCKTCENITKDTNALRIPYEQVGKVQVINEPMDYDLPATGGPGIYPLVITSVMLIFTTLLYWFILRRRQERGNMK